MPINDMAELIGLLFITTPSANKTQRPASG
ncbi:uncharacterized protein METZ01_LOCUS234464 [marine metagenome]|uniref:Uncharacterized protein n=1 Tax=marine metagenome TaxID=408172 RepID=A0A382H2W9_9ZZZZ